MSLSLSLSFSRTSTVIDTFLTVTAESGCVDGVSLTGVTVMLTVAVLESAEPLSALKVNESVPL